MMPDSTDGAIALLKQSCKVVREIADFFASEDTRAQRARKTLENRQRTSAKGKISAAFYAKVSMDLVALDETLRDLPPTWTDGQGPGVRAACDVLHVLEDEFLKKEELIRENDSEDEDESNGQANGDQTQNDSLFSNFAFLRTFVAEFNKEFGDEPDGADKTARIDWFFEVTTFGSPKGKSRNELLRTLKECNDMLQSMTISKFVDISYQNNRSEDLEWSEVGEAFRFFEQLHDTLEHWDCDCFPGMSHRNAKFAFDLGPVGHQGSVAGTIFYPSRDPNNNTPVLRRARLEFQADGISPTMRSSTHRNTVTKSEATSDLSDLCDLLEDIATRGEGAVKLAAGKPRLCDVPMHDFAFQEPFATGGSSFLDCYNLPQPQKLFKMSKKRRLSVALVLAYAYLHLGGGSWWPYLKKPNLHSLDLASEDMPPSRLVLFSPNFSRQTSQAQSTTDEELPYVLTAFNADMPSLPAFGKLLLELFVKQSVNWDELNTKMDRARDKAHATEILQVVTTCLATGMDKTFKGGGTIRNDERLRAHFVKGVVIPIQYVLRVGYRLSPQDIFRPASTSGVVEIRERPTRRPPVRIDGPETIGDGFCLHDGEEGLEELSKANCKSADEYFKELVDCSYKFLRRHGEHPRKIAPVKIAILDTGAHIPEEEAEDVYDGRIKECRTWLRSTKDSGEHLHGPCSDQDGHGTHGTSVLLEATQNTKIEIFVAQVFEKRTEKVKKDPIINDQTVGRIANALRYAVDKWEVDIISMSFGFPLPVPEIKAAIEYARQHNVLMLASASNCGGTRRRTWPARSDDVMCIYATDGDGNKYSKNPTPTSNKDNFAVLGDSVEALWPPLASEGKARRVRKSGTSTATPICAAIAGIVMTALRQNEDSFVSRFERDKQTEERAMYQRKTHALGQASVMASVFKLMVGEDGRRDDYQFIAPWRIFDEGSRSGSRSRSTTLENILGRIDA